MSVVVAGGREERETNKRVNILVNKPLRAAAMSADNVRG